MSGHRSTLFVGGLALDGLADALASEADIVCIDLEDAVPAPRKAEARAATLDALGRVIELPPNTRLIVRVNNLATPEGLADLRPMLAVEVLAGIMLPMVRSAADVRQAGEMANDARANVELYAIVETPEGLEACASIARAHPRLKALFFGGFDMSKALGCAMAWEPLLYARSRVVHAAALGGIDALDSPYPDADLEGLRRACEQARALGMRGKAAKQPAHVATINESFRGAAK